LKSYKIFWFLEWNQWFLNESNTTRSPAKVKIKVIQGISKQNIKPKCHIKWEEEFGVNINWTHIWTKLKKLLKFVLFKSQISFIIRKLLCRNEVNTIGLFLKVIEELQNILVFRMESMSLSVLYYKKNI
jgi:hypothetical protein